MTEPTARRRIPGLGAVLALAFLLLPIAGVAWWVNRQKGGTPEPGPDLPDLDVVCLGRVDGLMPVAYLEPSLPGKVAKVHDLEGKRVGPDTKLLELDDEAARLRVDEAKAAVAAAEVEIEAAKQEQKLYPLRKSTQEAAIAAAVDRVASARRLLEEKKTAKSFGTATTGEVIAAEAEVKHAEQVEGVERSRLKEVEAAEPGLKARAADAKKTLASVALKQAEKAVRDHVLVSPTAGRVLRVQASVGESIAPGTPQPPVLFLPDGPLVVRADLEQEFLGRVKEGMKATVRDDARADSPTWTGRVIRVGQVVARKKTILLEPGEMNDVRTVECVVALDGNPDGLLVGQRMRVRLVRAE